MATIRKGATRWYWTCSLRCYLFSWRRYIIFYYLYFFSPLLYLSKYLILCYEGIAAHEGPFDAKTLTSAGPVFASLFKDPPSAFAKGIQVGPTKFVCIKAEEKYVNLLTFNWFSFHINISIYPILFLISRKVLNIFFYPKISPTTAIFYFYYQYYFIFLTTHTTMIITWYLPLYCSSIYGKSGATGVVLTKTNAVLIAGFYNETQQPGNAVNVVEKIAEFLRSSGS